MYEFGRSRIDRSKRGMISRQQKMLE